MRRSRPRINPRRHAFIAVLCVTAVAAGASAQQAAPNKPAKSANPLIALTGAADPFAGVFKNDAVSVEFVYLVDKKTYSGTIQVSGQSFPLTAKREGDALRGAFTSGGDRFEFSAALDGDRLSLKTSSTVFELSRQATSGKPAPGPVVRTPAPPARPTTTIPAKPTPTPALTPKIPVAPKPAPPAPVGASVGADPILHAFAKPADLRDRDERSPLPLPPMEELVHEQSGMSIRRPTQWSLAPGPMNGVLFVTGDSAGALGGASDLAGGQDFTKRSTRHAVNVFRREARGATDPDDAQTRAFVENYIQTQHPGLRRDGDPLPVPTLRGMGVMHRFLGRAADGSQTRAVVYTTPYDGLRWFLVHAGPAEEVDRSQGLAQYMFASFGWRTGRVANHLLGTWSPPFINQAGTAGGEQPKAGAALRFGQDGHCELVYREATSGQVERVVDRGLWNAYDGVLLIVWQVGGRSQIHYQAAEQPGGAGLLQLQQQGRTVQILQRAAPPKEAEAPIDANPSN